jgi:Rad3-related DNA helicase
MMNRGKACDGCPYRAAKNRFKAARVGVTNYTYYIADMMYTGELGRSSVLVLDEAHNLERELLSTVDIKITPGRCQEIEAGALPRFAPQTTGSCQRWLDKTFIPKAKAYSAHLRNQIDLMSPGSDSPSAEEKQLQRKLDVLTSLLANVERFMKADDDEPWLAWSDDEGVLFIKPMSATGLAERHLFKHTDNVLLMSATILDFPTFRRNLGITAAESNSIAVPSDFPKENRRIIYWPVGNMGFKDIQATLPRMIERIIKLLDKWHDKKGIIHTHNYRITNELVAALKGTKFRTRVLTHTSLPGSREKAVEDHLNSEFETVLISPSMTEGLDLKDELSRFQIITKVPYPFLDPYTKARMERDPKWYQLQTALTLVQATGRSVRSKDDHAITVILDGAFERFLIQNQDILPEWWKESLEFR